ncbi:glycosyltransferase family 2 protein [bacterium]|nr:MAG: glycosyltransferase family 2 protein [bacterium]
MAQPDSTTPPCSVVIVNYNGTKLLENCLSSVLSQEYPSFEVLLVDNGSSDDSVSFVRAHFPEVSVIESATNLGYAGGNNLGARCARHDRIVLLNNDTIVQPGWLVHLMETFAGPAVGIASSLVITVGIPPEYYERNGSLNLLGHNIMRVFSVPENIFYGGGASVAFRKERFGEPFDADYFAYGEDVYLGLRCRFMGFQVKHVNDSRVQHLGGATSRQARPAWVTMLQERNRLLNLVLFFSAWTLFRLLPLFVLNAVAKLALAMGGKRYSAAGLLRAYGWFFSHPREIARKRQELRKERRVDEREVLSWMTARLTNGESAAGKAANWFSLAYCRITGLRTVESLPPGVR